MLQAKLYFLPKLALSLCVDFVVYGIEYSVYKIEEGILNHCSLFCLDFISADSLRFQVWRRVLEILKSRIIVNWRTGC